MLGTKYPNLRFPHPIPISIKLEVMSTDDKWIKVECAEEEVAMGLLTSTTRGKLVGKQSPHGLHFMCPFGVSVSSESLRQKFMTSYLKDSISVQSMLLSG